MEKMMVRGGEKLKGSVKVEGGKNGVLGVMGGCLLGSREKRVICDVGRVWDVYRMNEVLGDLGGEVDFENNEV